MTQARWVAALAGWVQHRKRPLPTAPAASDAFGRRPGGDVLSPEQPQCDAEGVRAAETGACCRRLDCQPATDRLVVTDHGPSGFDGPSCCDEVDVVVEGRDYGWPRVFGRDHGGFGAPAMLWQRTITPSGAAFVSLAGSSWTGSYVVAALQGRPCTGSPSAATG